MNHVTINVHAADANEASDVERLHYTVAQLIAELKNCNPDSPVVIKDLSSGKFGSLNFQGVSK